VCKARSPKSRCRHVVCSFLVVNNLGQKAHREAASWQNLNNWSVQISGLVAGPGPILRPQLQYVLLTRKQQDQKC
jgi:hypothetical protein